MNQFRLAKGVSLQENNGEPGGILSIPYPRRLIRLSVSGVEAIKQLCGLGVASKESSKLQVFATDMENQGVLTRIFPTLPEDQLPVVTIVIPTYNRQLMLGSCLKSLLALDYPAHKVEIIVVDDASPVPVDLGPYRSKVKLIRMAENGGPGAARNEAVKVAKGEIIAFLDDDCLAGKDWLRALVPCFQYPDVAAAGGRVESAELSSPIDNYEQVQSPLLMGASQRKVRKGSAISYLATCNLLVRKQSLLAVKGFDPSMRVGEDVDLCWRLLEKGENIYYIPEGLVFHHHRSELLAFLKRRFNYGQSEAKLQARYPKEKRKLVFFPGNSLIIVSGLVGLLLFGVIPGLLGALGLGVINLVWQAVSKLRAIKSGECKPDFWHMFWATARSQGTAVYLYGQHFSRYYSIIVTIVSLYIFPPLTPILLILHLLPGVIDYKLKKPSLSPLWFVSFHFMENAFYQAGVLSGCLTEKNWRPLRMDFIRADVHLLQRLAARN